MAAGRGRVTPRPGRTRWRRTAIAAATAVGLLVGWQLAAPRMGTAFELPTPTSTWLALVEMARSGELWTATKESGLVLLVGTVPAIVLGIAMGVVIGGLRPLDVAFAPYLYAFYSTPFVALIPLFLLVFGVGFKGKVAIVFTLVWLPVLLQTIAGVRDVDPRLLEVGRSFRASEWRMLFEVRLPAAMSLIVAGIRLAVGRALVGVVVAEFDTAFSGLGAEIFRYSQRFRLSHALVPALVLAATGIVLTALLHRAEHRLERWRRVD
ncbi:MAG TPA: ABC transporter permease [Actinomycetota bacterium]|nr:ABC transporter permease [Actinomycetota bacterium]